MKSAIKLSWLVAIALVLAGCRGISSSGEKQARHDFASLAGQYTNSDSITNLPELTLDSTLSNLVTYALLNSPAVKASFYDWSASIEKITVTRSLPDPQLTLQAYIQNVVTSLMPGFAWNFPGPGKLKARAQVAIAESQGKYFMFESAVLQSVFNLERAYYQLDLWQEQLRLKQETLALLQNQEQVLGTQNAAGLGNLTDVFQARDELDRTRNELASLQDSRSVVLENFKAALGLTVEQPNPPIPAHFEITRFEGGNENKDAEELVRTALQRNPDHKAMEADVRAAEAEIAVAYKERVPDFSVALMADVKASPVLYWPQAGMSLPVWRDKIAAEIAGAKAKEFAAESRLKAAHIDLVVSVAEKSFACRETARNLALIQNQLMPRARQSLETIRAGYRVGTMIFSSLTGAERALLDLQLAAAEARADHEIALADLSLLVVGIPPVNAPLLTNRDQH